MQLNSSSNNESAVMLATDAITKYTHIQDYDYKSNHYI